MKGLGLFFQKKILKLNLDLSFAQGFIKIRLLARFLHHFEVSSFLVFFDIPKNPDLGDVQIGAKHGKIDKKSKISIFLEKINLDLSFAQGFIKILYLARFLQHFEVG